MRTANKKAQLHYVYLWASLLSPFVLIACLSCPIAAALVDLVCVLNLPVVITLGYVSTWRSMRKRRLLNLKKRRDAIYSGTCLADLPSMSPLSSLYGRFAELVVGCGAVTMIVLTVSLYIYVVCGWYAMINAPGGFS